MINGIFFLIGFAFMFGLHLLSRYFDEMYMEIKALKPRTPIKAQGKFYYIVPEKEYIEMELKILEQNRQD